MPDLDHPTQSASLKRDGPDGTVVWKPGDIFKIPPNWYGLFGRVAPYEANGNALS